MLFALAGLAAKGIARLGARALARTGAKTVGGAIARAAGGVIATTAATGLAGAAIDRYRGVGGAGGGSLPPGFAPTQGGSGVPQPRSLPTRIAERLTPGGRTGREMTPFEGTEVDRAGRPIAVYPETRERLYAPPGYVIVRLPDGTPVAMLKGVARSMGLWHGAPKPPVNGWDMRAITRAASAKKRVKKLAGKVGLSMSAKRGR